MPIIVQPRPSLIKRPLKRLAARLALMAALAQIIMPLGQGMAQAAAFDQGQGATSGILVVCTQFGMELRTLDTANKAAPQNGPPQTRSAWDCPVCQLQISANTLTGPEPASGWQPSITTQPLRLVKARASVPTSVAARPHAPRAPPKS